MESQLTPAHIAAFINLAALVWGAAKMHSSIESLKNFKEGVSEKIEEHGEDIAKIDLRVSLVEQEIDGLNPPSQTGFEEDE